MVGRYIFAFVYNFAIFLFDDAFLVVELSSMDIVQDDRQVELGGKIGSLASWHLGIFASSDKCFFFVKLFKPWHLRVYRAL